MRTIERVPNPLASEVKRWKDVQGREFNPMIALSHAVYLTTDNKVTLQKQTVRWTYVGAKKVTKKVNITLLFIIRIIIIIY